MKVLNLRRFRLPDRIYFTDSASAELFYFDQKKSLLNNFCRQWCSILKMSFLQAKQAPFAFFQRSLIFSFDCIVSINQTGLSFPGLRSKRIFKRLIVRFCSFRIISASFFVCIESVPSPTSAMCLSLLDFCWSREQMSLHVWTGFLHISSCSKI